MLDNIRRTTSEKFRSISFGGKGILKNVAEDWETEFEELCELIEGGLDAFGEGGETAVQGLVDLGGPGTERRFCTHLCAFWVICLLLVVLIFYRTGHIRNELLCAWTLHFTNHLVIPTVELPSTIHQKFIAACDKPEYPSYKISNP
jgi:hypothetical protein